MRIKIFLKRTLCLLVTLFLAVTASACFDLGDFEDDQEYYDAFDDIRLVYQNVNSQTKDVKTSDYDVRDYFYNRNTGEDFTYGDPDDDELDEGKTIPRYPYVYMSIPFESNLSVDTLSLYMNATADAQLSIAFYVVDVLPDDGDFTNVQLFGEPEFQEKKDENGNVIVDESGNPELEPIEYSDPTQEFLVAKTTVHLKANEWDSFSVDTWLGKSKISIKKSQYLLLKFINNSGEKNAQDTEVYFQMTNLLVRAMSE